MIGILPAAGEATRIHGLPKWMLPVPHSFLLEVHVTRMFEASCSEVLIGANAQNEFLLDKYMAGSHAWVYPATQYETMTQTVLSARYAHDENFHKTESICFSMPDTYFEDDFIFPKMELSLEDGADVAVGVFKIRPGQHRKVGMCRIENDQVTGVADKPDQTIQEWAWGALAWKPIFWNYMQPDDPHVGYALPRAIEAGLNVRAVRMEGGYWDCGTPDEYFELIRHLTGERVAP